MASFKEVLEFYSLIDLRLRGNQFTWSNKHKDAIFTKERLLDRAMGNLEWTQIYLEWWVDSIVTLLWDHKTIVLSCNQKITSERQNEKLFRFEAWWNTKEDCENQISRSWSPNIEN